MFMRVTYIYREFESIKNRENAIYYYLPTYMNDVITC